LVYAVGDEAALAEAGAIARAHDAHLVVIRQQPGEDPEGARVFVDVGGRLGERVGASQHTALFLLDENLRVIGIHVPKEEPQWRSALTAQLDARPTLRPTLVTGQAPVLLIPDVLDGAFCDELIEVWKLHGNRPTGVEVSRDGERAEARDAAYKRRSDHTVPVSPLLDEISSRVGRRVMPEVRKAFAYRATRFEGFKICCYDAAEGGFFKLHRDNLSPSTAHRKFALTLNLNDDFDGGNLRFPEYGAYEYRPPRGSALVFSGTLLHEAMPVTSGRRFAALSFLFSEAEQPKPGRKLS